MLNKIIVMGRLTKEPELRYTQSQKPVASFTLACERDFAQSGERKETDFIDCVAWGKTAEFVDQYFVKGQMAIATGRLQMRQWKDRDGKNHVAAEIVADSVYFGEKKRAETEQNTPASGGGFHELNDSDGELPF